MDDGLSDDGECVTVPRGTVVHFINFCRCVPRLPSDMEEPSVIHVVEIRVRYLTSAVFQCEGNMFQHGDGRDVPQVERKERREWYGRIDFYS